MTLTTPRRRSALRAGLGHFLRRFAAASRYEPLFALTDAQLAVRGYSREGLTRTYFAGRAYP
ncbi:hypothetical protein P1J78_23485 [Psychromarinibacter sp. C21-152]|uniref:DUF1127 domain-containing protein n=1 Tax=Psychromarinibacter sediminicola TaxID=3033385 RepID=A0AAE3NZQ7_9RHOB|nr:hypothetical protein [Psychromarinibacter sediminicola]MDF0603692.1 hypothetical protein [Psychromarinibacter sediminicola]